MQINSIKGDEGSILCALIFSAGRIDCAAHTRAQIKITRYINSCLASSIRVHDHMAFRHEYSFRGKSSSTKLIKK